MLTISPRPRLRGDRLAIDAADDVSLQRELIEGYLKVGDVQGNLYGPNLGNHRGATTSYARALRIAQTMQRSDPRPRRGAAMSHAHTSKRRAAVRRWRCYGSGDAIPGRARGVRIARDITASGCLKQEKDVPGLSSSRAQRAGVGEDYVITNAKLSGGGAQSGAAATGTQKGMYRILGLDKTRN